MQITFSKRTFFAEIHVDMDLARHVEFADTNVVNRAYRDCKKKWVRRILGLIFLGSY